MGLAELAVGLTPAEPHLSVPAPLQPGPQRRRPHVLEVGVTAWPLLSSARLRQAVALWLQRTQAEARLLCTG